MVRVGIWFLIIGIGAFILPLMGFQFKLINIFGKYQYLIASICAVAGIVMIIIGVIKKKKIEVQPEQESSDKQIEK